MPITSTQKIKAFGSVTAGATLNSGAYGTASVTSGGTGIYNVTLSQAIPGNFSVQASVFAQNRFISATPTGVSSFQVLIANNGGTLISDSGFTFSVFG